MSDFIIKNSGEKVRFDVSRLTKWKKEAELRNVTDWADVVDKAIKRCPNALTTKDLHKALIDTCMESLDYDKCQVAARLMIGQLYKDVFGKIGLPDLKTYYKFMINEGLWEDMGYTDPELDTLNCKLQHTKDFSYTNTTVRQMIDKYLIKNRVTGKIYETPQFLFMGMAMMTYYDYTGADKVELVGEWYNLLSDLRWNCPTPIANSWRTKFKSYASCAVFKTDDTAPSIQAGSQIAYDLTTAQAGIGAYVDCRSEGDPVNKGRTIHQGKYPYFRYYDSAVRSTKQGDRGGAMTLYYSVLDPELLMLLHMKNIKTPAEKRLNFSDYGLQTNQMFWEKASRKEDWMLVSKYYAPKLYELFFSKDIKAFEAEYERVEQDLSIPKEYVNAFDVIAKTFAIQRQETGRIFLVFVDTMNQQTPFLDTIYTSNLCLEVFLPTKGFKNSRKLWEATQDNGEIALCNLSAIVATSDLTDELYYKLCKHGLRMVDKTISEMVYPYPSLEYTANSRRSVGIGITNTAAVMAELGLSYESSEGKQYLNFLAERHSYFLHKASLELGKELGNAPWINKTKYPTGWFPHKDFKGISYVSTLIDTDLKYDWVSLEQEIINNGGIRNSVLEAYMPCESSSQMSSAVNSIYPVRDVMVVKRAGSNTNIFFAPKYSDLLTRYSYENAYKISPKHMIDMYSITQRFCGQGISADQWLDLSEKDSKMSLSEWIKLYMLACKAGMKSFYYLNTGTDQDTGCEACKM